MTGVDVPLAYIDPGSGSLIVQIIIGSLLAVPFVLRNRLGRLYRTLRHRKPASPPDQRTGPTTGPR